MDRRGFIAGAAGLAAGANALPTFAEEFAERKPRVGLIGCGWYGKTDLIRLIQVAPVEVVALCDVDSQMLAGAADIIEGRQLSHNRPRTYADYRDMLKERDLDIVLVATPDHWHALPMIAAVQSGADVYCQKPISVDIVEGQAMLAAARKYKRVVQIGTQRRSTPHLQEARDLIKEGRLGKIGMVDTCCYYHMRATDNPPDTAAPANLDWDLWSGPAPLRPYNALAHPRSWRAFMEYGNGIVGDMCVHMLDMTRWMTGLGWPKTVASTGGIYVDRASKANISDTQSATFDYGDTQIVWQHRSYGAAPDPQYPWAATFYGDQGTLKASIMGYDFIPNKGAAIHKDVTDEYAQYSEDRTEKDLERPVTPAIRRHMQDFLRAIATRGRPVADIEEGHISTATCILANMSMKLGRSLAWDAQHQRVLRDDEANHLLRRPYRHPWTHPEPDKV